MKKVLKIAGGILFALFALSCAIRVPIAFVHLHQVSEQDLARAYGYVFGACAGVLVWGGVSFCLFRSAFKTNTNAEAQE